MKTNFQKLMLITLLFTGAITLSAIEEEKNQDKPSTTTKTGKAKLKFNFEYEGTTQEETSTPKEKPTQKHMPIRICVIDFTTINEKGQKRFRDFQNQPIEVPTLCTLNDKDRASIHPVMQGYVRMIDAYDSVATNQANRDAQRQNNDDRYNRAYELYNDVVKGEPRASIIGDEYLAANLSAHPDVFRLVPKENITQAMQQVSALPGFPQNFMTALSDASGATHLVYGTVSDIRSKQKSFSGYGVQTKSTVYELDVIIKVVDLKRQEIAHTAVYTGTYTERERPNVTNIDKNIFENLMRAALTQAANEIYELSKPGVQNKISVKCDKPETPPKTPTPPSEKTK